MKTPLTTPPAVGAAVNVSGTYASYTQTPLMIQMTDGAVVEAAKKPAATTTKRPVARRPR